MADAETSNRRRRGPATALAALAGVTALVAGVASGAAYAFITATGSSSGTVTAGTPVSVHVQAASSGAPVNKLLPGGTSDLVVQIQNDNPYTVTIVSVAQNGPVTPAGGSGCTSGNSGVSAATQSGLSISIPAKAGSVDTFVVTVPNGASMSTASASGCQGATYQIPVTVTVRR